MFGEFWEKEAKKCREDIKQTLQFNLGFDHEDQWKAHVESLLAWQVQSMVMQSGRVIMNDQHWQKLQENLVDHKIFLR
jgi:hypothetical protein